MYKTEILTVHQVKPRGIEHELFLICIITVIAFKHNKSKPDATIRMVKFHQK